MVNGWPPIVSVPVRGLVVRFAAAEYETVPVPDPLEPPVIVTQAAAEEAVHAQPESDVTVTDPVAPAAATDAPVGLSVWVHVSPACATVKLCPATVIVALRKVMVGFAVTL
jgi:hypothetical protein